MRVGILGTGIVDRTHATRLVEVGHDVMLGTRDVARTMAVGEPDRMGNPPFSTGSASIRPSHSGRLPRPRPTGRSS